MVIISSIYNEQYLLPWWLKHHKKIFDHGVLFNYYSTDRSVEIINEICPSWEVRETRNKDWNFADNDKEFMDAEREFDGYKMVLTTTEFLVGDLPKLPSESTCYSIPFCRIVDDKPEDIPTYDKPLVEQKNTEFVDKRDRYKRRFLHNYPDGKYDVGRHRSKLESVGVPMKIYKYVFAPWTEEFIERRLNMKTHMDPKDVKRRRGYHHTWDRERLEKEYKKALNNLR